MTDIDTRPRPIKDAFGTVGSVISWGGALATALVGFGVVTAVQGDAVVGLLGALPGIVSKLSDLVVAFKVTNRAEKETTPVVAPRDNAGAALIPAELPPGPPVAP